MTSDCESTSIIIFGASGDLTWRKLVPALYNNFKKSRLSTSTNVIGFARRPYSSETFRDYLRNGVEKFSPESFEIGTWDKFAEHIHYFNGNLDNADDFPKLDLFLRSLENGPANRLYYLATAPEFYSPVAGFLGVAGMSKDDEVYGPWRRIIIEKPFGRDLTSAVRTQPFNPCRLR